MVRKQQVILAVSAVLCLAIISCGKSDVEKSKEFISVGMFPEAIMLLNKRIADKADDPEAHFLLGVCFINTGNIREAEKRFASAVRLKSDYGIQIGGKYKKAGTDDLKKSDATMAIGLFTKAIEFQPDLKSEIVELSMKKVDALFNGIAQDSFPSQKKDHKKMMVALLDFASSLGHPGIADYYAKISETLNFPEEKTQFLEKAAGIDPKYKADLQQMYRDQATARLEQSLSGDLDAWGKAVVNAEKYLSKDKILQYAGKYFEKHYANVRPFSIEPKDGWVPKITVHNMQKVHYVSAEDFAMKGSFSNRSLECPKSLAIPKNCTFSGRGKISVSFKSNKPTKGYFWVE